MWGSSNVRPLVVAQSIMGSNPIPHPNWAVGVKVCTLVCRTTRSRSIRLLPTKGALK